MSKNNTDKNEVGRTEPSNDENNGLLNTLKLTAKALGIKHHPSIKLEALQEKIELFAMEQQEKDAKKAHIQSQRPTFTAEEIAMQKAKVNMINKAALIKKATRLIRVSVSCMDPNKRDWPGELFCAGNSIVPTQKKYVPYNGKPWYVPEIIYHMMKERQCQIFKNVEIDGNQIKKPFLIPALSIEILPHLTKDELEELKQEQAISQRVK